MTNVYLDDECFSPAKIFLSYIDIEEALKKSTFNVRKILWLEIPNSLRSRDTSSNILVQNVNNLCFYSTTCEFTLHLNACFFYTFQFLFQFLTHLFTSNPGSTIKTSISNITSTRLTKYKSLELIWFVFSIKVFRYYVDEFRKCNTSVKGYTVIFLISRLLVAHETL